MKQTSKINLDLYQLEYDRIHFSSDLKYLISIKICVYIVYNKIHSLL